MLQNLQAVRLAPGRLWPWARMKLTNQGGARVGRRASALSSVVEINVTTWCVAGPWCSSELSYVIVFTATWLDGVGSWCEGENEGHWAFGPAVWPWARDFASLGLGGLICETDVACVPPLSRGFIRMTRGTQGTGRLGQWTFCSGDHPPATR